MRRDNCGDCNDGSLKVGKGRQFASYARFTGLPLIICDTPHSLQVRVFLVVAVVVRL